MKKITLFLLCGLMVNAALAQLPWPATSPNPDSYGYTWRTNDDPNGPAVEWVEIISNGLGTEVMGLADDNAIGKIPMGIEFQYYWTGKTELCVGSNGFLSLNDGNCLNIASTATGFPPTPTNSAPNDVIAPYMCDLSFAGNNNPGKVYTYSDGTNNRFIVTYENVPYWVAAAQDPNEWSGSNTFQVVLDANDSTITFNYLNMSGDWSTGYDGATYPFVTGIENVSGTVGMMAPQLPITAASKPLSNTSIRFYPPATPLLAITDVDVAAVQNGDRAGFFIPWPQGGAVNNFPLRALISNAGNTVIDKDIVVLGQVNDSLNNLLWQELDTITNDIPVGGAEEITFDLQFNPPFPGPYSYSVIITNPTVLGDLNGTNNARTAELVATDTTDINNVKFDYVSDNLTKVLSPNEQNLGFINWQGSNSGGGVFIQPFSYPAKIHSAEFLILQLQNCNPTNGFTVKMHEAVPGSNIPGDEIYSQTLTLNEVNTNAAPPIVWTTVTFTDTVTIDSTGFYLGWLQDDDCLVLMAETGVMNPYSLRTYEIIAGGWGTYRTASAEDMYIRAIGDFGTATLTDIEDEELVSNFVTYPNPTDGELNIEFSLERPVAAELKIYDAAGKKVYREAIPSVSSLQRTVDLSHLSTGMYFVHLTTAEGVAIQRVVLR